MFDKLFIEKSRTEYVPYEKTVIEKKAPTDDSIRLYEEFKTKAYQSILDTIECNDNDFSYKAIIYEDALNDRKLCRYEVRLNGKPFRGEIKVRNEDTQDKGEIARRLVEDISVQMAKDIVLSVVKPSKTWDILK